MRDQLAERDGETLVWVRSGQEDHIAFLVNSQEEVSEDCVQVRWSTGHFQIVPIADVRQIEVRRKSSRVEKSKAEDADATDTPRKNKLEQNGRDDPFKSMRHPASKVSLGHVLPLKDASLHSRKLPLEVKKRTEHASERDRETLVWVRIGKEDHPAFLVSSQEEITRDCVRVRWSNGHFQVVPISNARQIEIRRTSSKPKRYTPENADRNTNKRSRMDECKNPTLSKRFPTIAISSSGQISPQKRRSFASHAVPPVVGQRASQLLSRKGRTRTAAKKLNNAKPYGKKTRWTGEQLDLIRELKGDIWSVSYGWKRKQVSNTC